MILGAGWPMFLGGIIPEEDHPRLLAAGVRRIYTPKDFQLGRILAEIVEIVCSPRPGAAS